MTQIISFSLLLSILVIAGKSNKLNTGYHPSIAIASAVVSIDAGQSSGTTQSEPVHEIPAALPSGPHREHKVHKIHVPRMEELAKIHRFHKERVRKVRKHHGVLWFAARIVLFLVHIAILTIAYLHYAAH